MITGILLLANAAVFPLLHVIQNNSVTIVVQWFGITFLATLPSAIASWILQSDQRFDKLILLRIINQG